MAFDVDKWVKEAKEKAGLTEDEVKGLTPLLQKEGLAKFLEEGTMLRSDYSRKQDELKAEFEKQAATLETEKGQWRDYGAKLKGWEADHQRQATDLERYREQYGDLNGGRPAAPAIDPAKFVSREDYEKAMSQQSDAFLGILEDATAIQGEHMARFGKPLVRTQLAELKKYALDNKMRLGDAYDRWIAPEVEKTRNAAIEARITAAREEGRKSALSEHKLPVDTRPPEPSPFWDKPAAPKDGVPAAPRDSFVNAWNESAQAAK